MAASITAASLTTTFTPEPRCSSLYYNSIRILSLGQPEPASVSACFPSGWASTSGNSLAGSICPSGYAFAQSTVLGGVTAGTCCPSFYSTVSGLLAQSPFFTGMVCTSEYLRNSTIRVTTTNSAGSYVPLTLTARSGDGINAYGISLVWSSTTSTSSSSSSSTTSTSSTTSNPTSTAAANSDDGGLSTGAKAGIGIGAALGALAIIGVLFFLFMRKRRSNKSAVDPNTANSAAYGAAGAPPHGQYFDQSGQQQLYAANGSPMQEQKYMAAGSPGNPTSPYQESYNGYAPVQQMASPHSPYTQHAGAYAPDANWQAAQQHVPQQTVMHEMPAGNERSNA